MRMKISDLAGAAMAVLVSALSLPGSAVAQNLAGHWQCQMGYAEYTAQGYLRGHSREFNLVLHPNGVFEAAGVMMSGAGPDPFQLRGNWRFNPQTGEVEAPGTAYHQSGSQGFMDVGGRVSPDGRVIQHDIRQPDSTGSYIAQQLAMICQR